VRVGTNKTSDFQRHKIRFASNLCKHLILILNIREVYTPSIAFLAGTFSGESLVYKASESKSAMCPSFKAKAN
jgi:hypothetical protein